MPPSEPNTEESTPRLVILVALMLGAVLVLVWSLRYPLAIIHESVFANLLICVSLSAIFACLKFVFETLQIIRERRTAKREDEP